MGLHRFLHRGNSLAMNNPALTELTQVMDFLKTNPPTWEENNTVPELVTLYLKSYPEGTQTIEDAAIDPHQVNGFLCDIVEALGVVADPDTASARLSALKNILNFAASAAMRDSALLGLLSFDAPDLYQTIHDAMEKEDNRILKQDMNRALKEIKL